MLKTQKLKAIMIILPSSSLDLSGEAISTEESSTMKYTSPVFRFRSGVLVIGDTYNDATPPAPGGVAGEAGGLLEKNEDLRAETGVVTVLPLPDVLALRIINAATHCLLFMTTVEPKQSKKLITTRQKI